MSNLLNVYSTLHELPELDFPHELHGARDRSDPQLLPHLQGFAGFVHSLFQGQMTQKKYHVWRHIQRVQNHLSLTVEDDDMDDFARWAWEANAIVFTPDGGVRNPDGVVLIQAPDIEPDPKAIVPYPADALARKAKTEKLLQAKQIPVAASLPPVVGLGEMSLRNSDDVVRRMLCLFTVAVRAESLATNQEIPVEKLKEKFSIIWDDFSPAEHAFLKAKEPEQQVVINFAWRYEALAVLQWSLGLTNELPFPDAICDVPEAARLARENNSEKFVAHAEIRPLEDVLDALDLHLRLHWAAREARLRSTPLTTKLEEGVIRERHHALNWLVRFEDSDWDDVDTPT